jgi:oligopeptide/dipeptide ABC transporter ATP-binding protein
MKIDWRAEIAAKGTIYTAPQHPYTQALIAAVPVLRPQDRGRGRRTRLAGDIPSALNPPAGRRFHTLYPHVMTICRTREPVLRKTAEGHQVACHLVESGGAAPILAK